MNEAQAIRESTPLEKKLDELNRQNKAIELCWKDLYGLRESLNILGKKVNSSAHPDSNEKSAIAPGNNGPSEDPNTDGGLIGELQNIINVRQSLIFEFNNSIYPKLQMEIYHLTGQI